MLSAENLLYNTAALANRSNNNNNGNKQNTKNNNNYRNIEETTTTDDVNSISDSLLEGNTNNMMMMNNNTNDQQQQQEQLAGVSLAQDAKRRKAVSASSILGKIVVTDLPTGEKISQWGGTECYLSFMSGHGACLVVRGSRHKRGEGTLFQLRSLQRVLHQHVEQGKLTLQIPHMKRQCLIYITTTDSQSLPHLALMAATLDDPRRWGDLEMNAGRDGNRGGGGGGRGRPRGSKNAGGDGEDGEAEVMLTKPSARDALLAQDDDLNFE